MIVRSLAEINNTERDVQTPNWRSRRIVLSNDGAGFSLHETVMRAGTVNDFQYVNHIEAVLVIEGTGKLIDQDTAQTYDLTPGTMYLLNGHERHRVLPETDIRAVCVFNPALTGGEVHDDRGAYPILAGGERSTL
jgi:L-ectoine synthase